MLHSSLGLMKSHRAHLCVLMGLSQESSGPRRSLVQSIYQPRETMMSILSYIKLNQKDTWDQRNAKSYVFQCRHQFQMEFCTGTKGKSKRAQSPPSSYMCWWWWPHSHFKRSEVCTASPPSSYTLHIQGPLISCYFSISSQFRRSHEFITHKPITDIIEAYLPGCSIAVLLEYSKGSLCLVLISQANVCKN